MTHTFKPEIIRAYDIRGRIGDNLSADDAYHVGRSLASIAFKSSQNRKVIIGYDGRLSSPELFESLKKGFIESGAEVINIGLVATPMVYFASIKFDAVAAIMITGSHNPPDENGFKMVLNNRPFYGDMIKNLSDIAQSADYIDGVGLESFCDIKKEYVEKITTLNPIEVGSEFKVGWDSGNGAAGEVLNLILDVIPTHNIAINTEIDGNFPNHHPDPSVEKNVKQLSDLIISEVLNLGLAYDGDGDRVGLLDDKGRLVAGDKVLLILARDYLNKFPNSTVVCDVKCSDLVIKEIKSLGGEVIISRTGHSFIKEIMKEKDVALAGEMSGHMFFGGDYLGYDDGLFASLRLLSILSKSNERLSEIINEMPKSFSTPEIKIMVEESIKFKIVDNLVQAVKNDGLDCLDIDGARVSTEIGWWLVRASNTQSCLVLRVEAYTEESFTELKSEVSGYLEQVGINFDF